MINLFLTASAQAGAQGGSGISMLVMMGALFIIMWFFMIRPQQKKQKEIQKAREALKVGDQIVTAGGIYGRIREIGDVYMAIEVANGVTIRIDKSSIFASSADAKQQ